MVNIVILGNGVDWGAVCLAGIKQYNAKIINTVFPCDDQSFMEMISKVLLAPSRSKMFPLVIRYKLYNYFFRYMDLNNHPESWIIIYDHNRLCNDTTFLSYIKRRMPNVKLIYIFTNIAKLSYASDKNFLGELKKYYDIVFAFDPEDAKKYGFSYSPLIYDADPNYKREEKESKEDLVFYVGQAKDRLSGLLSCFEKLKQLGIKTDFHIANVKEEDIKYSDEIIYNKFMTYAECVDSIQKATCLIDVIQGESTGLTIKTCEAVCYDKKLITTNKHVVEYPFYDPRYIRVVDSPDDIDGSFFTENKDVHYSEEGKAYFSAESFLKRVEDELKER